MRILVFAIPERGHINPLLPTLRRLRERGHAITIATARDLRATLQAAELDADCEVLASPAPPERFLTAGRAFAERLRDPEWLAGWIQALLIDAVPAQLPSTEDVLRRVAPDVVISDPMLYAAAIACARADVPWAGVSSSLNPVTPATWRTALTETLDRHAERRAQMFRDADVPVPRFFVSDAESPWLNVAFTSRAYVPHEFPAHIELVGAPFAERDRHARGEEVPFPWERLSDKDRLYVSFGSQAFYQPRLFQAVFAAASALDLQVIASVGELIDEPDFVASAPADAILVRYVPQLALLPRVHVMVSHGGANSAVEALAHDLPLVLLTLCNDQPLQARFLSASGAGCALDASQGEVDSVALEDALRFARSAGARERAREVGASLRSAGGPDRVAELVCALGERRLDAKERT